MFKTKTTGAIFLIILGAVLFIGYVLVNGLNTERPPALKISVIFDVGGQGDGGFNDMAYAGVEKAAQEMGDKLSISTFQGSSSGDNREFLLHLQGQNEADLVICVGYIFSEPLKVAAPQYPHTKFAIIDGYIPGLKRESNITCLTFREHEGSFLVGAAAALKSKTGIVGFVGGMVSPLIKKFEAGYIGGAKFINPNIVVLSDYVGTTVTAFMDPRAAYEISANQYDAGADIIYHAAGGSGLGVLDAAQKKGKFMIGVDLDQSLTVPDEKRPYILTSMIKRVDIAVYNTIKLASQKKLQGGYSELGLSEDGVGYAINIYNADLLKDITNNLETIKTGIINQSIAVPGGR